MWPEEYLNYEDDEAIYWFSNPYEPLNNWSAHAVRIGGEEFKTVEHAYHYQKYKDDHPEVAKIIKEAPSPWAAMQIDRMHVKKRRSDWQKVKVGIMTELVTLKHTQNEDVRGILKRSAGKRIVENSPWDDFWGIGKDNNGENMMGKIWMQIRGRE